MPTTVPRFNSRNLDTKESAAETESLSTRIYTCPLKGKAYDTVEFLCKSKWDNGQDPDIEIKCKAKLIKMNQLRVKQGKMPLGMYDTITKGMKFESVEEFDLFLIDYVSSND